MTQTDLPLLLAVDDEPANLMLLQRLFQNHFQVVSAHSGEEALDLLNQAPFDVVLLDIMMPMMNGLQVLETIRSRPSTADVPVILVSALGSAKDIVRGLRLGANDYISKPIETDVTIARVQTQVMLKRLQDERKQTIAELRAAQEMKDRFLRMASHDLKGPLTNIHMAQSLLTETLAHDEEGLHLLEIIRASVLGMQNVITDFLDSAALQSGVLDLHFDRVELATMIKTLVTQYSLNAQQKNITLQVHETPGVAWADAERLSQAVGNLISNAIKYSPHDTVVTIWTEAEEATVRICVADEGPGIPIAERNRLFTQFGKLSTRPTDGESSTGLGLWIVKHLVTLQNGTVGVETPADGGSIFYIDIPAAE